MEKANYLNHLSIRELCTELNISPIDARDLKNALKHYKTLSDNSKSNNEMAIELERSCRTIGQYRSCLIKQKLIKPRKMGRIIDIESVKKLGTQKTKGLTYRTSYFNKNVMKAANLNPQEKYFYKTEPKNKAILVTFLTPEEVKKLKS